MPSYDFRCEACDTVFEDTVTYEDRLDVKCNICEGPTTIVWFKLGKPVLFYEGNYQIEFGSREGVHCTSKRKLLDAIKYANDRNPNPVELTSEYYG